MTGQDAKTMKDPQQTEVAMDWLMHLRDEAVNEQDIGEWARWYESDESHKQAFDQMQTFWEQIGRLTADPERAARIRQLGLAPDAAYNVRLNLATRRRPLALIGAALAALLVLAAGFAILPRHEPSSVATAPPLAFVPALVRETLLPDGSKVELAAKSSVEVEYTEQKRLLHLQGGEAYFSVAANHNRPFVVAVGGIKVRAVGTEFNIRKADDRVVVTVTKGIVDVYPAQEKHPDRQDAAEHPSPNGVRVSAGNQVAWSELAKTPTVTAVDAGRALAWKEGRLEYIDEPLSAVIADVNRYTDHPVVIGSPAVARLAFTGTVFIQSTDEWLRSLPSEFPVTLVSGRDNSLVLTARNSNPTP